MSLRLLRLKQYVSKGWTVLEKAKSDPCVQIPHRQIFVIVCCRKFQHNMHFSVTHVSEVDDSVSGKTGQLQSHMDTDWQV